MQAVKELSVLAAHFVIAEKAECLLCAHQAPRAPLLVHEVHFPAYLRAQNPTLALVSTFATALALVQGAHLVQRVTLNEAQVRNLLQQLAWESLERSCMR